MTSSSTEGIKTVLHPVSDLAAAKPVYAALLGVPPQTDESYYVGFEAAGQQIGLVPRWGAAGPDLTGGLLARAGHRGEAGRGDSRWRHREGARPRRGWRPPGGRRHRPGRQRPRAAPGPVSAHPRSRQSPALQFADSHDVIRVHRRARKTSRTSASRSRKRRLTEAVRGVSARSPCGRPRHLRGARHVGDRGRGVLWRWRDEHAGGARRPGPARRRGQVGHHHRAPPGGRGARRLDHRPRPRRRHDGGRIVFEGIPPNLVADRSILTGEHLAAYVGT